MDVLAGFGSCQLFNILKPDYRMCSPSVVSRPEAMFSRVRGSTMEQEGKLVILEPDGRESLGHTLYLIKHTLVVYKGLIHL